jgi:RHS repeat-associated protein
MAVDTRYITHSRWTSLTATELTYPDGRQVTSGYDALYRRNSIDETSGGASIAAWQFFGQRTATVSLGNGLVSSNMNNAQTRSAIQLGQTTPAWGDITTDHLGYDGAGRLIGKRYLDGSSVNVGFTSAYDKSSNKLFERPLHAESRASLYDSYDSMNRLLDYERGVLASGGGSITTPIALPGTNQEQAYNLDGLGNWTTTTITPEGGSSSTQSRTHNKLNEVTAYGVLPTSTPVQYDHGKNTAPHGSRGNGNIADDGVRLYAYDALNRMTTVKRKSDGATIGQYTYDAQGRRILKVVSNGGLSGTIANGTTRYLYDGDQSVEELSVGITTVTTRQFVWGQYIDELIQLKSYVDTGSQPLAAGTYYLLSDLLYRSTALTDASKAIVEAYDCDAYGNTLIFSGPGPDSTWFTDDDVTSLQPACEYIFTGRQYDPESQIYFYRARYYHPPLGRFVSRDPLLHVSDLNLYAYTLGNPSATSDPLGLLADTCISKGTRDYGPWHFSALTAGPVTAARTGQGGLNLEMRNTRAWYVRQYRMLYECCDATDSVYWLWGSPAWEAGVKDSAEGAPAWSVLAITTGGGNLQIPVPVPWGPLGTQNVPVPGLRLPTQLWGNTQPQWQGYLGPGSPDVWRDLTQSNPMKGDGTALSTVLKNPFGCSCMTHSQSPGTGPKLT